MRGLKLRLAENNKYFYEEQNIPTDKNNNKKSRSTNWLKFIIKFVPIPVLIFLLVFFIIKVITAYAIIYTVLSIIAKSLIYYIFFHKNRKNNDKNDLEEIETVPKEEKESVKDKIEKNAELKKTVEALPWKYGKVEFDGFGNSSSEYNGNHTMIFRYKHNKTKNGQIVCIQYCICSSSLSGENKLETCRVYTEEFPDPEITIELNVVEDLYLKVGNALTFCDGNGKQIDENVLQQLNATINLDDKSQDLKGIMDEVAKNKITNRLIKD